MTMPTESPAPAATRWPHAGTLAVVALAVVVLLLVFGMYSQPGFLVMLTDMIWACFG